MHDATEAYLGDVLGPIKKSPMYAEYRALEHKLMLAICAKFGMAYHTLPPAVCVADQCVLDIEMRALKEPRDAQPPIADSGLISIECYSPQRAKQLFLTEFFKLVKVIPVL